MSVSMASTVTIARTVIIAIPSLILLDKLGKIWFFQKTFCRLTLAWFFTFSFANIWFVGRKLVYKNYTAANIFLVEDSIRKKFASWSMLCPATLYWYHLDAQDKLINGLIICEAQIMVEFNGVDAGVGGGDKLVKKSSKSRKSLKDLKNLQKPLVRKNVYWSTNSLAKNSSFY